MDDYDYILIDCPPALGFLTINAFVAGDSVLVPLQAEFYALEGLSHLMRTIERVRRAFKPELRIRGLLRTMFDGRTNLAQDVVDEVRSHFDAKVFEAVIPRSVRLAEAPSHGLPISAYAPRSAGALAYEQLADEILAADGQRVPANAAGQEA
jgi:chromosome partitioning protein